MRGPGVARTRGRAWVFTLLMLGTTLAPAPALAARLRALLVGANEGWDEQTLRYARDDARKVREVLLHMGGFVDEGIVLLEDPTADELRAQLEEMKRAFGRASQEETLFVFYYSGHADQHRLHLRGAPELTMQELLQALRQIPATQKVGILDACQSGALLKGSVLDPLGFRVSQKDELSVEGLALLVSSTATESSQESPYLGGSFFTHYLVSGLFGLADANRDRKVSLDEVFRYARERTIAATTHTRQGVQHPGALIELAGYRELYLTFLRGSSAVLVFPADWPRCFLMDRYESRLLAESPALESSRQVRVAPGTYALKCEDRAGVLRVAHFAVAAGEVLNVSQRLRFAEVPRMGALLKGGNAARERGLLPIVSGGAFAAGGMFWILAKKEHTRLRGDSPSLDTPEKVQHSVSRGRNYQVLGLGLMGAGVVGIGVATGMYLLGQPEAPVTVGVGPGTPSVLVRGRWP